MLDIINLYELRCLKNCMRIKARLEELGLPCGQKLYEALGDQSDDKQTEVITMLHFLRAYHVPCYIMLNNYLLLLIVVI